MPGQLVPDDRVVHAVEELADVQLKEPLMLAGIATGARERRFAALAPAAGVAVEGGGALEDRLADVHEGVMEDAIAERGGADEALFGFVQGEAAVFAEGDGTRDQIPPQAGQFAVEAGGEPAHLGAGFLAPAGLPEGEPKVLRLGDLFEDAAQAFHG